MILSGGKEKNTNLSQVQEHLYLSLCHLCYIYFIFGHYEIFYFNFGKRCLCQVFDKRCLCKGAFMQIALTLITKPEIFALFHGWNNYNSWIVKFQGTLQLLKRSFKSFSVCMTVNSKVHFSRIFFT